MSAKPATAYSYIRWSDPIQTGGDTLTRQTAKRDEWLRRNNATLDTSLRMRDEGVSAFKGQHRSDPDKYALAEFLREVERGKVVPGSYLLVEGMDRISREDIWNALDLVGQILRAGIKIVQLEPVEQVFDRANSNPMQVMMMIMELSRGHSESAMKSMRVGEAWVRGRELARQTTTSTDGQRILSRKIPGWCKITGEKLVQLRPGGKGVLFGRLVEDKERAALVRRIFKLAGEGYGVAAICRELNGEKIKPWNKPRKLKKPRPDDKPKRHEWAISTVYEMLTSRVVLGEYQPMTSHKTDGKRKPAAEVITGYYPQVITPAQFDAVQQRLRDRKNKGGRPSSKTRHVNLWTGLLKDARDGGSMVAHHCDRRPSFYKNINSKQSDGNSASIPLVEYDRSILRHLAEIDPADVLPQTDTPNPVVALSGRLSQIDAKLAKLSAELEHDDPSPTILAVVKKLESERKRVVEELSAAKQSNASPVAESWGEVRTLVDVLDKADDRTAALMRLRGAIRRIVERMYVYVIGGGTGQPRLMVTQMQFTGGGQRMWLTYYKPQSGKRPAVVEPFSAKLPADITVSLTHPELQQMYRNQFGGKYGLPV